MRTDIEPHRELWAAPGCEPEGSPLRTGLPRPELKRLRRPLTGAPTAPRWLGPRQIVTVSAQRPQNCPMDIDLRPQLVAMATSGRPTHAVEPVPRFVSSCSRVRCLGCAFTRHLPAAAGETLTSTRPRAGASPAVRESASATCPGAGAACRVACHQRATTKARSTLAPWGRGRWACIRRQGLLDRVGVECPHPAGAQCECCPPGTCGRRPPSASHPCEGVQGDRPCCAQRLRRPVLFGEGWLATLSRCPDLTLRWSPPCPSRRRLPTWRPSSG